MMFYDVVCMVVKVTNILPRVVWAEWAIYRNKKYAYALSMLWCITLSIARWLLLSLGSLLTASVHEMLNCTILNSDSRCRLSCLPVARSQLTRYDDMTRELTITRGKTKRQRLWLHLMSFSTNGSFLDGNEGVCSSGCVASHRLFSLSSTSATGV